MRCPCLNCLIAGSRISHGQKMFADLVSPPPPPHISRLSEQPRQHWALSDTSGLARTHHVGSWTCHLSLTGHRTERSQGLVIYLQIWRLHGSESTHKTRQGCWRKRSDRGKLLSTANHFNCQSFVRSISFCFYMILRNWFIVFVIFRLTVNYFTCSGEKEQTV